ncbi:MAG TPA: APC family permease [Candidatus Dormibacteraeota bacterium]|nr:APC family permease [Candidatus Dormibacteraeota bacterium]
MNEPPKLVRGLGLIEATSLNMTFMVGIGPFVVIPFVIQIMHGGTQALVAWVAGAILAACDGCIWAELGAAMPEAGGSYVFLREAYGPKRWGHLLAFLYIWQTLFQGPLSVASGALGFADYSQYLVNRSSWLSRTIGAFASGLRMNSSNIIAAVVLVAVIVLLYRRIGQIGKISVVFAVAVIGTILWIIWGGMAHFNAHRVFDFSSGGWNLSFFFFAALGHATVQTIYSYLGYYNVCNLGSEMKNPERNIPAAIFISILGITGLYLAMQVSILSVIPWQEAAKSKFIASTFIERAYGSHWATLATVLILITALGSVFSAMLGYSRVPYAAALDGNFLSVFARVHKKKHFPHVSLVALGLTAIVFSMAFSLISVIKAILAMRCLVQFAGQGIGLIVLHKRYAEGRWPGGRFPFRMWLYPLPVGIAIIGWIGIFISTGRVAIFASLAAAIAGILVYLTRARWARQWPFAVEEVAP